MSKPTKEQLERLEHIVKYYRTGNRSIIDSEKYHLEFDKILEEKLVELDPEWIKEMNKLYTQSKAKRWYS